MEKPDEFLQLLKSRKKIPVCKVLETNTAFFEQQGLSRKHRYGSKSQKGIVIPKMKKRPTRKTRTTLTALPSQ